jgi:hypothetical protein
MNDLIQFEAHTDQLIAAIKDGDENAISEAQMAIGVALESGKRCYLIAMVKGVAAAIHKEERRRRLRDER